MKKVFSKRDSTNWSYKLYTITEVIHDTIPTYRSSCFNERQRKIVRITSIYLSPRFKYLFFYKSFVNDDDGTLGGTHWNFFTKDNKSIYFDSLGRVPDKILLNQLPKPINFLNYKIEDINSRFCGSYC